MTQVDWRHVTPQYDEYSAQLEQFPDISPFPFSDIQHRFRDALTRFVRLSNLSRVLLVNAQDNSIYRQMIVESLVTALDDQTLPVIKTESLNAVSLFDQVQSKDGKIIATKPGLLSRANNGYLIVSANLILANPGSWLLLKSALLGEAVEPISSNPEHLNQSPTLPLTYNIKLVVVGDRAQLGDLDYLDSDIQTGFCLFSEIEQDIKISHDTLTQYLGYLKWLQQRYNLPNITQQALIGILTAGARETEDQSYIPLCPIWHNALLNEALVEADNGEIDVHHIQQA